MKKRIVLWEVFILVTLLMASSAHAEEPGMGSYCSAPPSAARSLPPNIMVLMDNSQDMLNPAYTGEYDPATLIDPAKTPYGGYFIPHGCYTYQGTTFVEALNGSRSYTASETCPSAAPFRGNLLNWATMSRFDILQKVLIGGNAEAGHNNASILVSISGVWQDRNYGQCIFRVADAGLAITESFPGACALLDDPAVPIAFWDQSAPKHLFAWFSQGVRTVLAGFSAGWKGLVASVSKAGEGVHLIGQAWASSASVEQSASARLHTYRVKVELVGEPLHDLNGNDIYDGPPETYTDSNGNGTWDGKQGIIQRFWDENNPRARWGLATFSKQKGTVSVAVDSCIPASPASSFYTRIQNAAVVDNAPLAQGLYGVLNHFGFTSDNFSAYVSSSYYGCKNDDPFDDIPCRKNFVLIISSGHDVSGPHFRQTGCPVSLVSNSAAPLVQNACFGSTNDLRSDKVRSQNVSTYVVNPGGTDPANNKVLEDAALAGNGKYYYGGDPAALESGLLRAIQDVITQAASGTAVSVLTAPFRRAGSAVQAHFAPKTQEGSRDIWWTGYVQNFWIDPQDNLREDSDQNADHALRLELNKDKVMKPFFNPLTNETEAALFTTEADGTGGTLAACTEPEIKSFSAVTPLWEAGKKLALMNPSDRYLFTSKKVIRGAAITHTFPSQEFTLGMNAPLLSALNPDTTTYTAENVIRYVRGECLETGVTGNAACGPIADSRFRDRRLTVDGSLRVWKLGDIVSSTPRVFGTMPNNAYSIDYDDPTYYEYVSSSTYKNRSSVVFVGANDGMLHAFRVGYLKDTGLSGSLKAILKNYFRSGDAAHDDVGEELWAYIPFNAFPYLKYLAMPEYNTCHLSFVDLSARLVDVSIGNSQSQPIDTRTEGSWRTILIGGMRFGGACSGTGADPNGPPAGAPANTGFSSYFALDVTDVGTGNDRTAEPVPLWEFTDADMGYATSHPSIIRTGEPGTNGNWYVAVGSGSTVLPRSGVRGKDIGRSTEGFVYILDLKTGELRKKISLGHHAIVGDMLAVDANKNYRSEKLYFGTAYSDGMSNQWRGKIMSVAVPENSPLDDANWPAPVIRTLFDGPYPFTASPDAAEDETGQVWVYAGSGKFYTDRDGQDTSQQIFIGLKDTNPAVVVPEGRASSTCPRACPAGSLCDVTRCTTSGEVRSTVPVCAYNAVGKRFELQDVVTAVSGASVAPKSDLGWKIYFQRGERSLSRPLTVGGLVDFLSYTPSADLCSLGGESFLYSVDYTTGVAPKKVAVRAPGATSGTSGTVIVHNRVSLGPGAPPPGDAIVIPPQKEGGEIVKKKIQVATGAIVEAENKPPSSTASKVMHWLKK